jgi:uracil-DNA glycosylase family 4
VSLEVLNRELIACRRCPRLVAWREEIAHTKRRAYRNWDYWGKPVPGFGDPQARVMVVGLAPGAHGSNRTGRMFTGDASGDFLYAALHRAGFANQPRAGHRDDGLILTDLFITAVCRCAPPGNKPRSDELANCEPYLLSEIRLIKPKGIVCLGRLAFERFQRMFSIHGPNFKFGHGTVYKLASNHAVTDSLQAVRWILCSYHPSQQNTQTGRLTVPMFDEIWRRVQALLSES